MRHSFEQTLRPLSEQADRELAGPQEDHGQLAALMKEFARRNDIPRFAQETIYELEKEKRTISLELEASLRRLDDGEDPGRPESAEETPALPVTYVNGRYFTSFNGSGHELTLGEIMTGEERGVAFDLDGESVPTDVRRRFLIEQARLRILSLLNDQIFTLEVNRRSADPKLRRAYEHYYENHATGSESKGLVAEKVISAFFKRLEFDCDLDFSFEPADMYQDITQKIDFIIRRHRHQRGVGVDSEAGDEMAGIQFTLDSSASTLARKQQQVEFSHQSLLTHGAELHDILLVHVPDSVADDIYNAYRKHKESGEPGAVDRFLSEETKKTLFEHILQGMYAQEEIAEQWEKVRGSALGQENM